jgi:glycosyltransferase involved in cell wall biosynthesis
MPGPGFDQAQILILSSIDWDSAWQRHQIFASQLAQAGHDVFFVENSGFRNPGLADLSRLRGKALGRPQPPAAPASLRVVAPRVLPPTWSLFRRANAALFIPLLADELRARGLKPGPLVVAYYPTATTLELIQRLEPRVLVYDCASNFRAHPQTPRDFAGQERELLDRADLVVCDSEFLYEQKRAEHGKVLQIHQGVPEGFFGAEPPAADHRRLCYYGTWGPDHDPAFLASLRDAGFEVTVSGFIKGARPLPSGVRHLPPVRREELVCRLQDFDAFLLPYRINPFLMGVVPAKLYECLAMGRPVLATPLPCFAGLERLIHVSGEPAEWARIARDLPRTETAGLRQERIALAREHTCAREFQRFHAALRAAWTRGPSRPHAL